MSGPDPRGWLDHVTAGDVGLGESPMQPFKYLGTEGDSFIEVFGVQMRVQSSPEIVAALERLQAQQATLDRLKGYVAALKADIEDAINAECEHYGTEAHVVSREAMADVSVKEGSGLSSNCPSCLHAQDGIRHA